MPRPTRRKATLLGLALTGAAGVLALGLAGPNIAFAQPSPSAPPSATAPGPAPDKEDRAARRTQQEQELAAALAKELGIDQAKVAAALTKVRDQRQAQAKADRTAALKTRLDAAVAEGKLTREQADAILKAAEAGVLPGGRGGGGRHGGPGRPGR